ncbi:MAG: L-rhamnose/proton symporter RhaT [Nibricoccus sp.]
MHPLASSIFFHAVGAASAALCYAPQKRVKRWSWQSYWLIQAAFCWFLLPVIGAFLTIPDYWSVVQAIPREVALRVFLLGMAYGVGGTAFGVAIRYVGFSVTYAMAIGISTVVGTSYAIVKGATSLADASANIHAFTAKAGSGWVLAGIGIAIVGIMFCGVAGRGKERDQAKNRAAEAPAGSAIVGLLLCVVAGVLSGVYGVALAEGGAIATLAEANAAGHTVLGIDAATFTSNAIYPFSNAGAFLTTALYCLFLHRRDKTLSEVVRLPEGKEKASLAVNWAMAILTGCLWYGQFFFYGFGHYFIMKVAGFGEVCWAIHMILLIMLGTLAGVFFGEWKGSSRRTSVALALTIAILVVGVVILAYGNYAGQNAR